jgi:integrase
MQHLIENLQFKADIPFVSESSPCFRPLEYPPKDDFVMSIDADESVISFYGNDTWDFISFGSPKLMPFEEYDFENKKLFKQMMFYIIYSHLFPGKYNSLRGWFQSLQPIFRKCTELKIKASDLSRYPKVIEEIARLKASISPSTFTDDVYYFDQLFKLRSEIGFTLLNDNSISLYKTFDPEYEAGQTPYIPSQIWTKFIQHLDIVFDDFEANQDKLESLYDYLVSTTITNQINGFKHPSPFDNNRCADKIKYGRTFEDYLNDHGLFDLFEKYAGRRGGTVGFETSQFNYVINNTMVSCYLYILFYSLMRKKEALSLRTDCLKTEIDERLGNFYLLAGETTKTDPDSDDRWVINKRVARAVTIAKTLIDWKLRHIDPPEQTPFLFQRVDAWTKAVRSNKVRDFDKCDHLIEHGYKFFNKNQFVITQQDYDEALALTPKLARQDWFKVGNIWQFSFHQFRRTLAVHFALNKISPSSTQLQMKHSTREQQFHYQNNAGKLRLNHLAEQEVVNEYYAEMARNIASVVHGDAILPHKQSPVKQDVVCFVEEGEMKKLLKAQKNGAVGYRKNLLGGCMKQGTCEYGGFDSITHCAGGTGGNMCSDLIIDGSREQEFEDDKAYYEEQMDEVLEDSPRYGAFKAEVRGYEKVLDVIKAKKGGTQ